MADKELRSGSKKRLPWGEILLVTALILTVLAGAYLRLVGVNWDESQHLHPDERHISQVQSALAPVESAAEYFNTATSTLNPANRGHAFFVYGTLPIFIVRYLGEALGQTDYNTITMVGRQVSAVFDLATVLLVYAIGRRLYNKWVGLLGGLFYALAVLPIQLSHFATVDTITNTFAYLAVFAAVWALTRPMENDQTNDYEDDSEEPREGTDWQKARAVVRDLLPYILFGIALGAATASKINAVVLALLLPLVEAIRYSRLPAEARQAALWPVFRRLIVAAALSFITFRVGQPYAFTGPSFFNFGIDPNWWASLQSLRAQASGQVDFPPALQWARRPLTFSLENLVAWGLGLPLGIFAWLAYIAMGWVIVRQRKWYPHLPLWAFTGLYFAWQSFSWVRSMRYQMLIYPALALFAGWGLVQLWSARKDIKIGFLRLRPKLIRWVGAILTLAVVLTTAVWAFAFSRIYTQPITRLAASRWIYDNIPGALTLKIDQGSGVVQQPLPYRAGDLLTQDEPFSLPFYAIADSRLSSVTLPHILDQNGIADVKQLILTVHPADDLDQVLGSAVLASDFSPLDDDWRGASYDFYFETPAAFIKDKLYYLEIKVAQGDPILLLNGSPTLNLVTGAGMALADPLPLINQSVQPGSPYTMTVQMVHTGLVTEVTTPYLVDLTPTSGSKRLTLTLSLPGQEGNESIVHLTSEFSPGSDARGKPYTFKLDEPLAVESGQSLVVILSTETPGVQLMLHAPAPVHESSWDDAIPYPVDGFSPYSESGGIYRGDLNFEMYWPDNEQKLARFESLLNSADFLFITSSRQWGTTTRVPERYPLTTHFYRELLGCPPDAEVEWCFNVAEPGMFSGSLGFDLVKVFQVNPRLGTWEINDQPAEEAFTVYDHPKVFIFQKAETFDSIAMRENLRSVDLSQVVYFTPGDAANYKEPDPSQNDDPRFNLMLPDDRFKTQREGGTWTALFDRESLLNTSQPLAVIALYSLVSLLGVLCYPILRQALPGLSDRGYPLSKLAGLLVLAFVVWWLGSLGVAFSVETVLIVLVGIVVVSAVFIYLQRHTLWQEIKTHWRYFIMVEILAGLAFVLFLLVRLGNPDLWHPYKGGEKPMDFSYLNAVLKSTTFPPYDPWFAGGYINYYYYGFVLVGVPIKLLGIVPAVAYNIVLPLWFSLLITAAFSVGWNLYRGIPRSRALKAGEPSEQRVLGKAFGVGLATAIGLAVLGNLGTVRFIITGYQRIASDGVAVESAALFQRIGWTFQGFVQFLRGTPMPFYPGDWYWFPSRIIPGEAITEFPFFTFLYGDLHAHLIAFPITIFVVSWSFSVVLSRARWGEIDGRFKWLGTILGFALGGLVIGALRPTNTWDFYTYLVLAAIALLYSLVRHYQPRLKSAFTGSHRLERWAVAFGAVGMLVLLAVSFYQPFAHWFGQGYNQIKIWDGDRTPLNSYLTHWGLFLFVIVSWMGWESYHWMKTTPHSALKGLEPYRTRIYAALILFVIVMVALLLLGVVVALIAVPIGLWAVMLMLRPGRSDGSRFHLFLIGTAVALSLAVELIYLPGDIGRMNTVFKFYLQAWILFALSAGVCLGWVLQSLRYWRPRLAVVWQVILFALVISAALFTLLGTTDKIRDRMAPDTPHSLDGMAYMADATYYDLGVEMDLAEDDAAIRWLQENVQGSPVILEGQAYEYRWGNRMTINTGLPGVVGWNWHQRQQRAILRSNVVQERVDAVGTFYLTEDLTFVQDFVDQFQVRYIVVGQLERIFFPGAGLQKFVQQTNVLWREVYRSGSTVIYEVIN